jgi:hypothetical protein
MKQVTHLFDGLSGSTFIGGVITGQTILIILGGLASFMAILNHGLQFYERFNKQKKAAQAAKEE